MNVLSRLIARATDWERELRASYNTDLSSSENRRRARIYNLWFDHEILRIVWTNHFPVAAGVWRSNHPTRKRLAKLKEMGIRTILNLRGSGGAAHYLTERENCEALGLTMVDCNLSARSAATRDELLHLIETFRSIEKPFVMHCKSGADRAGLASAIYLMTIEGEPVAAARRMLGPKYVHFKWTKTGILDHILDLYAVEEAVGRSFEDWVREDYDPAAIEASWAARRRRGGAAG